MYYGEISPALLGVIANHEHFWFATEGGCVYLMGAAVDLLRLLDRTIIATGTVYSAGVPILASASHRIATTNCSFMVHVPTMEQDETVAAGQAIKNAEELKRVSDLYFEILGARTKRTATWWSKQCAKGDFYFDAKTALRLGVVDSLQ